MNYFSTTKESRDHVYKFNIWANKFFFVFCVLDALRGSEKKLFVNLKSTHVKPSRKTLLAVTSYRIPPSNSR